MEKIENVRYATDEWCQLDIYLPEKVGFETIVYFHGGGLENGDKADKWYVEIAESFVKAGYGFISVNYTMYTHGAKFPQFLEEAALAVAFAKENIGKYGGNGTLYLSGQSAGAWIALMLCTNGTYLSSVGIDRKEIKGWIIDSAQTTSHFNVQAYEKGIDQWLQRIDEYAPLYYVNKDTSFSKMLLLFYAEDMPCRAEQNMLFYKAIKHYNPNAKVVYKQLPGTHCYGSTQKEEDGEYRYVKETLTWLKN